MTSASELRKTARARLADAEALFSARRYDAAVYICGYAVEIALKARVCRTLRWGGYPETGAEFKSYQSFRTHDLDVLLHLSGREGRIKARMLAEWSDVAQWNPEARYQPVGSATMQDVHDMIESTRTLLRALA